MKHFLSLAMFASISCAFAQEGGTVIYQDSRTVRIGAPVQGAPYSATIVNEMIQTLADGNHIVNTSTGTTARDSQGRTRRDMPLPAIGSLTAANAPQIVFIQDPVAQTAYALNLTEKTAHQMPQPPPLAGVAAGSAAGGGTFHRVQQSGVAGAAAGAAEAGNTFFIQMKTGPETADPMPPPMATFEKRVIVDEPAQEETEDLGSQVMEGVTVNGARTTRTIAAGQIGNEKPIVIVTEVWTSPELKTVVCSKRSDPRTGEQTFRLTNIVREEPDPSLFTVPADFKIIEGPQTIHYRPIQ